MARNIRSFCRVLPRGSPSKKRGIRVVLHDLFLQSLERAPAFTIQSRHVDREDSEQTVRLVLSTCSLSVGRPRHASGDADVFKSSLVPQDGGGDFCNLLERVRVVGLGGYDVPLPVQEEYVGGRDKLLQGPSTLMPRAEIEALLDVLFVD